MQTIVNLKRHFKVFSDFFSRQAVIHVGIGGTTGAARRVKGKHLPWIHVWKLLWFQVPPQESK